MSKTLVIIISDQTIPNFLFISHYYSSGDGILFFDTATRCEQKNWILRTLEKNGVRIPDGNIESVLLEEENWLQMCADIEQKVEKNRRYLVNLTGGTKYMSLAVQSVFEKYKNITEFFYIPYPKNNILEPYTDKCSTLNHRVSIDEYMSVHNIKYGKGKPTQSKAYTEILFELFLKGLTTADLEVLDKLRKLRSKGLDDIDDFAQNGKYINKGKKHEKFYEPVPHLPVTLSNIDFQPEKANCLSKDEIEYLTGGWFEEYMYYFVKQEIKPDDIAIGMTISHGVETNPNELDVVFTKGNKFFVIECKTSIHKIEGVKGEEAMFKEIAYKAATIKATLLRLPGFSIICSLNDANEKYRKIAKNMGINYYDKSMFADEEKKREFINGILGYAN